MENVIDESVDIRLNVAVNELANFVNKVLSELFNVFFFV